MTRKDFEAIAQAIRDAYRAPERNHTSSSDLDFALAHLASDIAAYLEEQYSLFDPIRFLVAAGATA